MRAQSEWGSDLCPRATLSTRRSHDAVIRVYDEAGNVIETHQHAGDFREQKRC
jgi:hypothetical protein